MAFKDLTPKTMEFQTLFDHMAQGAFLQNADGALCDVNRAALELFGLDRDEFLGRTSYNSEWRVLKENGQPMLPEDHPSMAALLSGQPVYGSIAGVFNPRRNSYVWIEINAIPLVREVETKPYQVFVTLHDITGRRLIEEELRERVADLAEAQRVALFGNWKFDMITGRVRWSEELYSIFDMEMTESGPTYESFLQLVHPEDRQLVLETNRKAAATGESFEIEYRILPRSGKVRFIREVGNARKDRCGKVVGLFGVAQDITDRKLADKKILGYQERLRALTEEISSVEEQERKRIAGLLHDEIGQVLAIMKIRLGSLCSTEPEAERKAELEEVLAELQDTITFVRSLTSDLVPVILYQLGLDAAVESFCEDFRQRHGIKVEYQSSCPKVPFHDNQLLLFKAIRELMYNALKHAEARNIRVSLSRDDTALRAVIEDDGVGIHGKQEPENGGRFGLFSIKERLRNIGGTFSIQSTPGSGTRVTLLFPFSGSRTDRDDRAGS